MHRLQIHHTRPSYKEIMFEAATRAYTDADVNPRRDIDCFTVTANDLYGIATAYMPIYARMND